MSAFLRLVQAARAQHRGTPRYVSVGVIDVNGDAAAGRAELERRAEAMRASGELRPEDIAMARVIVDPVTVIASSS